MKVIDTEAAELSLPTRRVDLATSAQAAALLTDSRAADNFRNLFELPVLFYVALVVADRIGMVDGISLGLAWAFVALRVVHSAIQRELRRAASSSPRLR